MISQLRVDASSYQTTGPYPWVFLFTLLAPEALHIGNIALDNLQQEQSAALTHGFHSLQRILQSTGLWAMGKSCKQLLQQVVKYHAVKVTTQRALLGMNHWHYMDSSTALDNLQEVLAAAFTHSLHAL